MPEDFFITEFDEIKKIIMNSEKVYLYDRVLISHNEQTYFKTEELMVRDFIGDDVVILIEAVYKEMLAANKSETGLSQRYVDYLSQFKTVIYIDEACLSQVVVTSLLI